MHNFWISGYCQKNWALIVEKTKKEDEYLIPLISFLAGNLEMDPFSTNLTRLNCDVIICLAELKIARHQFDKKPIILRFFPNKSSVIVIWTTIENCELVKDVSMYIIKFYIEKTILLFWFFDFWGLFVTVFYVRWCAFFYYVRKILAN